MSVRQDSFQLAALDQRALETLISVPNHFQSQELFSVTWHINTESFHSLVDGPETKQSLSYLIHLTPPGYRWISLQSSSSSGKL